MLIRRRCCVNALLFMICAGSVSYILMKSLSQTQEMSSSPSRNGEIKMEPQHVVTSKLSEIKPQHVVTSKLSEMESQHVVSSKRSEMEPQHVVSSKLSEMESQHVVSSKRSEMKAQHVVSSKRSEMEPQHVISSKRSEMEPQHVVSSKRSEMEPQHVVSSKRSKFHQKNDGHFQHSFNLGTFKLLHKENLEKYLVRRFPKFIIVGFGKAGTKALYEALKLHPLLAGPETEKRFFSLHYGNGLKSYLQTFPDPPLGGYTIEKSPDYIVKPYTAARITTAAYSLNLDPHTMKFIIVLRNPIDRAMSEHIEWDIQRRLSQKPPLRRFHEMVLTRDKTHLNSSLKFLNASCYAYHIRNWQQFFTNEQLCFVDGDMFIRSPYIELFYLEQCLGLSQFFTPDNFIYDKTRGFYCFMDSSRTAEKLCMNKSKGRKHPHIPENVYRQLHEYFQTWNSQLPTITGRNFTQW